MTRQIDIPGYQNYQITDDGRVWRKPRTVHYAKTNKRRVSTRSYKGKWLNQTPDKSGYLKVHLSNDAGSKTLYVHRLVLLAFVGPSSLEVNHKNGKKDQNELSNLEYVTHQENTLHAFRTNLSSGKKGSKHSQSKLSDVSAAHAYLLFNKYGWSGSRISKALDVAPTTIYALTGGRTWRHVTKQLA